MVRHEPGVPPGGVEQFVILPQGEQVQAVGLAKPHLFTGPADQGAGGGDAAVVYRRGEVPGLDEPLLGPRRNRVLAARRQDPGAGEQEVQQTGCQQHQAQRGDAEETEPVLPALRQQIVEDDQGSRSHHAQCPAQDRRESDGHQQPGGVDPVVSGNQQDGGEEQDHRPDVLHERGHQPHRCGDDGQQALFAGAGDPGDPLRHAVHGPRAVQAVPQDHDADHGHDRVAGETREDILRRHQLQPGQQQQDEDGDQVHPDHFQDEENHGQGQHQDNQHDVCRHEVTRSSIFTPSRSEMILGGDGDQLRE